MGWWNYRVIKRTYGEEDGYEFHEVYYNDAGEIKSWTTEPVNPHGSNMAELRDDLQRMLEALDKPVLEECVDLGDDTWETVKEYLKEVEDVKEDRELDS